MHRMNTVLASILLALTAAGAQAEITNPGFEAPGLVGWTTLGNKGVWTSANGINPTEGLSAAFMSTGSVSLGTGFPSPAGVIGPAVGLPSGALSGLGAVTHGAAMYQTFSGSAGDTISFDWNFLTNETGATGPKDFSWVALIASGGVVIELTTLADTTFPSLTSAPGTGFNKQTGWRTFSHTLTTNDTYRIAFGVLDVFDELVDSGLIVDNFVLAPIPLPHPAALAAMGLFGMTCIRRDRRLP